MSSTAFDRSYPNEEEVALARDILKPPGILSKAYNKHQLKKVERDYAFGTKPASQEALLKKFQTDRLTLTDSSNRIDYFHVKTTHDQPSTYDRIKHMEPGYNPKLHRDDRKHAKSRGLKVNLEETALAIPNLSSSIYGHPNRTQMDYPSRTHCHVEVCKKDFLRLTGTNIGKEE